MGDNWTSRIGNESLSPTKKIRFINHNTNHSLNSTQPKIDSSYVKNTVKDIIAKSKHRVKVDPVVFDNIMKLEKEKAKVGRGIGKYLDLQEKKTTATHRI